MKPAALEAPRLSSALGRGMGLVFKQQEADLKTTETKKKTHNNNVFNQRAVYCPASPKSRGHTGEV